MCPHVSGRTESITIDVMCVVTVIATAQTRKRWNGNYAAEDMVKHLLCRENSTLRQGKIQSADLDMRLLLRMRLK